MAFSSSVLLFFLQLFFPFSFLLSYLHIVLSVLIVTPSLPFLLSTSDFCIALNFLPSLYFLIFFIINFFIFLDFDVTLVNHCSILPFRFLYMPVELGLARSGRYIPKIYLPYPLSPVATLLLTSNNLILPLINLYC